MSRFGNLEFGDEHEDLSLGHTASAGDEARYFGEAEGAFANGDFEAALRRYSKVLEFNPNNAAAWTGQVRMLIEMGEFREAKLWADKALERFPREPELLAAKAVALARTDDTQGAIAFSDASIEERGDTPYIWLARGDVLLARGENRADYCFEKALALAPGNWLIAWLAARIRYFYKQFALALKLAQQALECNTSHFILWLEVGRCQHALGLVTLAQASYHQAQQLNPRSSEAIAAVESLARVGWWERLSERLRQFFIR